MSKIPAARRILVNITKPLEANFDVELNKLSLFTGMNGTGKTFIMIHLYALGKIGRMIKMGIKDEQLLAYSQWVLSKCLSDMDTNGIITVTYGDDEKVSISLEMKEGEVESIKYEGFEEIEEISGVKFMSVGMRTFDDIKSYLFARGLIMKETKNDLNHTVIKMAEHYKLYDIDYVEGMIASMPLKIEPKYLEYLKGFDVHEEVAEIGLDDKKNDFYFTVKGSEERKYLTTFGKGHQSVFNMFIGNLI